MDTAVKGIALSFVVMARLGITSNRQFESSTAQPHSPG
jgi:hypothetical protein